MAQFIDRRPNGRHKSAVNRQRFIRRFKNQIRQAVRQAITKRHVTDIEAGEKITIPTKDISEPTIYHGIGGVREVVYPGNTDFLTGDRIKRPANEDALQGNEASDTGEGLDDFNFELTKEEFLDMFFDDLALPHLVKKQLNQAPSHKLIRAGFSAYGTPSNLNIIRTFRGAIGRRIALSAPYKKRLQQIIEQPETGSEEKGNNKTIPNEIEFLKKKIHSFPRIEALDLRYNNRIKQPNPSTQAVMFCLMDVSGSMDEEKKDMAKRFFILLYLFLTRNYEKIDIVFIRHHTVAKEVDEKEFFYSRETGGTVVSSALDLMKKIIQERYPIAYWNIYCAQASDGDNWNADSPYCQELLLKYLIPTMQYYAYIEIKPRQHQSLWEAFLTVKEKCPNFAMEHIENIEDIYPVFHDLFKRQT